MLFWLTPDDFILVNDRRFHSVCMRRSGLQRVKLDTVHLYNRLEHPCRLTGLWYLRKTTIFTSFVVYIYHDVGFLGFGQETRSEETFSVN